MKRFEFFLQQLGKLLAEASHQDDPGLWLYKNNFRTPLFMLEALSKMYAAFHNRKRFIKLEEQFKFLEDVLGGADYYDSFAKEFSADKTIPEAVVVYLQIKFREKITSLNGVLKNKNWLTENKRLSKIENSLVTANWKKEKKEMSLLQGYYSNEITGITAFVQKMNFHFDNVEADVHELRRKLRWLSIYPQALRGSIQLVKKEPVPEHLAKYLTTEIVTSPFNKMPDAGDNENFLLLDQNYFFALSWMIAELGKIKDNGLRVIALKEALQQTEKLKEADAFKRAYELLGDKQPQLQQLLSDAESICRTYFKEKNLENLVIGTAKGK